MEKVIIVNHHEIVLKGDNRRYFEKQLKNNIIHILKDLVRKDELLGGYGRFIIKISDEKRVEEIVNRLKTVFGVANICLALKIPQDIQMFCRAAESLLQGSDFRKFKVHTKRTDKSFPFNSVAVNIEVGAFICSKFNTKVDLTSPEVTIYIDIADGYAFVYRDKIAGAGGLPSGTAGRVVSLLSAGFDSPVASWKIMRRGASVIFVHFHSMPYTSRNSVEQVQKIVRLLTRYQLLSKLYIVPFADLQKEIVIHAPQNLRVILYRRMMLKIAELIAYTEKAEAILTGEAVGQVASQTLRNIRNIDSATSMPVLRPLCGDDKEEIMKVAIRIGTYDISKEPYDDCCSFLTPRKPETWSNIEEIIETENKLDVNNLVKNVMEKIHVEKFNFP